MDNTIMDFGTAISNLKSGLKVARRGWNGEGMYLAIVGSLEYKLKIWGNEDNLLPWIGMKTADNKFVPWIASQADVLAEDWQVVD